MIINIIDNRKRKYRFEKVNAIIEAAWHDNRCQDADQVLLKEGPDYAEKEHISLTAAIEWAQSFTDPITLFIYDENEGR